MALQEWAFVRNDGKEPVTFTSPRLARRGGFSLATPGVQVKMVGTRQTIAPKQTMKVPWDVYLESIYRPLMGRVTVVTEDDFDLAIEKEQVAVKKLAALAEAQAREPKKRGRPRLTFG